MVAIPGASSVGQLESNVAAADIELTEHEYQALHAAATRFRPVDKVTRKVVARCQMHVSRLENLAAVLRRGHRAA